MRNKGYIKKRGVYHIQEEWGKLETKVKKRIQKRKEEIEDTKEGGYIRQNVKIAITYTQGKPNSILRRK